MYALGQSRRLSSSSASAWLQGYSHNYSLLLLLFLLFLFLLPSFYCTLKQKFEIARQNILEVNLFVYKHFALFAFNTFSSGFSASHSRQSQMAWDTRTIHMYINIHTYTLYMYVQACMLCIMYQATHATIRIKLKCGSRRFIRFVLSIGDKYFKICIAACVV